MIFDVIYSSYQSDIIGIPLSGYATGFLLEDQALPYLSLQGTNHSVIERFSSHDQLEICVANFLVYAESRAETRAIMKGLETIYDRDFPEFNKIQFSSAGIEQLQPQLFFGRLEFDVYYQRSSDSTELGVTLPDAPNFETALYSRWVGRGLAIPFYTDGIPPELQSLPYAVIPAFNFSPDSSTTHSRLDYSDFRIHLFDERLVDVENKIDEIIKVFNFCQVNTTAEEDLKQLTSLIHYGHNYMEMEPQVWRGEVSFEMKLERDY